jgi:ComF family protein
LKSLLLAISDVIFPPLCPNCEVPVKQEEHGFCPECLSRIKTITTPLCICCGIPFASSSADDHLCAECIDSRPPFSRARAVGYFEATLLDAIHRFKYGHHMITGEVLGRMMAVYQYPGLNPDGFDIVIPVPLHLQRLRERGFNQSLILARNIAERYSIPLDFTVLKRHIKTTAQVGLGRKERGKNVRGAFNVRYPERVSGKRVLLIDDVYTTGSTLKECAGILSGAGAEEVAVITLARVV